MYDQAARYLEVEERFWYCKPGQYAADPKELVDLVDENTVLVCAIIGTTYTGASLLRSRQASADRHRMKASTKTCRLSTICSSRRTSRKV